MVTSKLKCYFVIKKPYSVLKRHISCCNKQKTGNVQASLMCVVEKSQEASYKVPELIVKAKKPHTMSETLLMPACKKMVKIVLHLEPTSEISKIPLSTNTTSQSHSQWHVQLH